MESIRTKVGSFASNVHVVLNYILYIFFHKLTLLTPQEKTKINLLPPWIHQRKLLSPKLYFPTFPPPNIRLKFEKGPPWPPPLFAAASEAATASKVLRRHFRTRKRSSRVSWNRRRSKSWSFTSTSARRCRRRRWDPDRDSLGIRGRSTSTPWTGTRGKRSPTRRISSFSSTNWRPNTWRTKINTSSRRRLSGLSPSCRKPGD